jgi:hypothetical protein
MPNCLGDVALAHTGRDGDRLQHVRRLLPCEVRVTSTRHPLFGSLLQATGFKRWKGQLMLVVVLPDGSPGTIPVDVTDLLGAMAAPGPAAVLTVEGVRSLRSLVGALTPAKRSTSRVKTRK